MTNPMTAMCFSHTSDGVKKYTEKCSHFFIIYIYSNLTKNSYNVGLLVSRKYTNFEAQ